MASFSHNQSKEVDKDQERPESMLREYESAQKKSKELTDTKTTTALNQELPLQNDPEYFKYFFMLEHGVTFTDVKQSSIKHEGILKC